MALEKAMIEGVELKEGLGGWVLRRRFEGWRQMREEGGGRGFLRRRRANESSDHEQRERFVRKPSRGTRTAATTMKGGENKYGSEEQKETNKLLG